MLEGLLEEILRRRVYKRNADYIRDRDFKKLKKWGISYKERFSQLYLSLLAFIKN